MTHRSTTRLGKVSGIRAILVFAAAAVIVVGAILAFVAIRAWTPAPDWNVLLITFDTTRADRIASYGYEHIDTPTVDALASDGVRYTRCYAPVPLTLPSHCTIMTGLYPFHHGVHLNGTQRLDEQATTLAEVLKAHGFATGAAVGSYVLDGRFGLDQGFDVYDDDMSEGAQATRFGFVERTADKVTDAAIEWLEARDGQRFFFWAHYFDPHNPYDPPGFNEATSGRSPYDAEIEYADGQAGRLVDHIGQVAGDRPTLIIVTADHGEALWEHGEPTHGLFTYEVTMRVPLVVRFPDDRGQGAVIDEPVSLADVFPSVLAWLGIDMPHQVHGAVLPTAPGSAPEVDRAVYIENQATAARFGWAPIHGLVHDAHKFIDLPQPELYDVVGDPLEQQNLVAQQPEQADRMAAMLSELKEVRLDHPALGTRVETLDRDSLAKLRALGYISWEAGESEAGRQDPKEALGLFQDILKAQSLIEQDQSGQAVDLLARVLADDHGNWRALWLLNGVGDNERWRDDLIEVFQRYRDTVLPTPLDYLVPAKLGVLLSRRGRYDEAIEAFERALTARSDDANVHFNMGLTMRLAGRPLVAWLAHLEQAHASSPTDVSHGLFLAQIYEGLERLDQAAAIYEELLASHPDDAAILNNLAWVYYRTEADLERALELAARAVEAAPAEASPRHTLGCLLLTAGRHHEAAESLEKAVELRVEFPDAYYRLGRVREALGDNDEATRAYRIALGQASGDAAWRTDAQARLAKLRR